VIQPLGAPALLYQLRDTRWPLPREQAGQQPFHPAERPLQRLVAHQPRPLWVLLEQQLPVVGRLQLRAMADAYRRCLG
jgi:hypothetical protein